MRTCARSRSNGRAGWVLDLNQKMRDARHLQVIGNHPLGIRQQLLVTGQRGCTTGIDEAGQRDAVQVLLVTNVKLRMRDHTGCNQNAAEYQVYEIQDRKRRLA